MSVLILHASASVEDAASIATELAQRGIGAALRSVSRGLSLFERRALGRAVSKARTVLVLWSRAAAPLLRDLAHRALRAGKLVLARLDLERPPLRAVALDLSSSNKARAIGALAGALKGSQPMMTEAISPPRSMRLEGAGVMLVFALVVATAVYFTDAAFAARVNDTAHDAQTGAMALLDRIKS